MNLLQSIVLGLVQGFTEFLPVSSSGHLVLFGKLLHAEEQGIAFEVWLHLATLTAVGVALWPDILEMLRSLSPRAEAGTARRGRRMVVGVIVGTIPAVLVGLLLKDKVEAAFTSVRLVGVDLVVTAAILLLSRRFRGGRAPLTASRAWFVGMAQALAILPGISRAGSTLTAGLGMGLSGADAARFSFILSMPAILGAVVLEAESLTRLGAASPGVLVAGFLSAALSGYLAVRIVWRVMERGRLFWFAPYCALLGLAVILLGSKLAP